ncbi:MAG: hypothetical protein DMG96_07165, partial [Acidobacteria bacterium]
LILLKQHNATRDRHTPGSFWSRQQKLFSQILRQVARYAMYVDVFNKNHAAATRRLPCTLNQRLGNKPIDKNMEMRVAVFLKLKDTDIDDQDAKPALQINPPLSKRFVYIRNGLRLMNEPSI